MNAGCRGHPLHPTSSSSGDRKYNSLIQTQARELSHLRQRMREGQRVCHILTQNMGDTTKVRQTQTLNIIIIIIVVIIIMM